MPTTYVAFDRRSGRILSVHRGASDGSEARESAHRHSGVSHEHVGVMTVVPELVEREKRYKVDVETNTFVTVPEGEDGVSFSFGGTSRAY